MTRPASPPGTGPTFYGQHTANGEMYDGNALTAAHQTLPMPVNVRVTNLDNGKSIIVRVNDRGPYARGRIIDLSKRAAELLDVVQTGTARVRVTYLGRADLERRAAAVRNPARDRQRPAGRARRQGGQRGPGHRARRRGGAAGRTSAACPRRAPIPPPVFADNQPTGQVTKVPVPAATHLYVQVGAFSKLENAKTLLAKLGGDLRISTLQRNGQTLYRVRTGPLDFGRRTPTPRLSRITGAGAQRRPDRRRSVTCHGALMLRRLSCLLPLLLAAVAAAGARRHRHQRRACA